MSGDSPTPVEELGLSKHDLAMIDVNQLSPEERERSQGAVVELDLLLTDPQFVGDYEKLKTTKETASLKSVEEGLSKEVRLKIKGLIEQTALAKTGHADVAAAQKNLGKQWGAAMQGVVEVYYEGKEYPIDKMNNPELEAKKWCGRGFVCGTDKGTRNFRHN